MLRVLYMAILTLVLEVLLKGPVTGHDTTRGGRTDEHARKAPPKRPSGTTRRRGRMRTHGRDAPERNPNRAGHVKSHRLSPVP